MKKDVLSSRQKALDWTNYRLAKALSELRQKGSASGYTNAVARAVENPETASLKTFEELVRAMGGEVVVRWPETKVVGYEEISGDDGDRSDKAR